MDEDIKTEIRGYANSLLTEGCDKSKVANDIMLSFIFGKPYGCGRNEHFNIDEIYELVCIQYDVMFTVIVEE